VAQNLAMPITLDVEALPPGVGSRVERLGVEVGLAPEIMRQPLAAADHATRTRVRLGKALALDPRVLLAEHPNAGLDQEDVPRFAAELFNIAAGRRLAMLVMTADPAFGATACRLLLRLNAATGALAADSAWRKWLVRRGR